MLALLTSFLGSMAKSVVDGLMDYYKSWKLERDKTIAQDRALVLEGQIGSLKAVEVQEAQLAAAAVLKPVTSKPSQWLVTGTGLGLMLLAGCCGTPRTSFVHDKHAIIPMPARTALPPGPDEWTPREEVLVQRVEALEAVINAYNAQASEQNTANGY